MTGEQDSTRTDHKTAYLARAGYNYDSATFTAIFSTEKKAENWLDDAESKLIGDENSVWRSVDEFVIDEECPDKVGGTDAE